MSLWVTLRRDTSRASSTRVGFHVSGEQCRGLGVSNQLSSFVSPRFMSESGSYWGGNWWCMGWPTCVTKEGWSGLRGQNPWGDRAQLVVNHCRVILPPQSGSGDLQNGSYPPLTESLEAFKVTLRNLVKFVQPYKQLIPRVQVAGIRGHVRGVEPTGHEPCVDTRTLANCELF
ncbi:hypothetical protein RRG08_062610 [Elysia crispata]|uniref:Uncharacterized protein n=1 Tax=Elysia crispata TaxID=231223 RepID=A0AAE1D7Q3_9GAST|nr:hypothetical protein RRG08_062610 [Elysia crispata]